MKFTRGQRVGTAALTFLFAACGPDMVTPIADDPAGAEFFTGQGGEALAAVVAAPVQSCTTVTFDGFAHGDIVDMLAVPLFGGFNLTVSVVDETAPSDNVAKIYDSGTAHADGDQDLQVPGVGGLCDACDGNMMVIPNTDFATNGDSNGGGTIVLTGFPAEGESTIKSFSAVDQGPEPDEMIHLEIDGANVGGSSAMGDGTVETVVPTETVIVSEAAFVFAGSGAVDNLEICHTPPPPPPGVGTGTIGYWKNHPEAWPVDEITIGGVPYTVEQAIAIMNTPGKGDKTYDMFAQLVAAKLNVLIGNESDCIDETIALADAWLSMYTVGIGVKANSDAWQTAASGWHTTLDEYNNGNLCAPHRG